MTNRDKIDKKTNKDYAKMLLELSRSNRGCGNCCLSDKYCTTKMGDDCFTNIYNWLSQEVELTADEMFEELGYIKEKKEFNGVQYAKGNTVIVVTRENKYFKCMKSYERGNEIEFITEQEDKAIHKKIEELKNEKHNNN